VFAGEQDGAAFEFKAARCGLSKMDPDDDITLIRRDAKVLVDHGVGEQERLAATGHPVAGKRIVYPAEPGGIKRGRGKSWFEAHAGRS